MTCTSENTLRDQIARFGRSLFQRGYGCGSSGNISVRVDDGVLVTPTNSCMGFLEPELISKVGFDGTHLSGSKPSKETFFHLAMYEERPQDAAIVHLHATHSVAVSCLDGIDKANVLPPMTAYYVMRIGKLPLVPYYRPGDRALADAVRKTARDHHAMLLANHGPVVSAQTLDAAVYCAEELEETAKLYLMIHDRPHRYLTHNQIAELTEAFPN
jgi:ribulose-5-phosphate 4-epimerase/fuculose-1-phosphate aldolase